MEKLLEVDPVMEVFWFSFLVSALFFVLALIIGYWYINYKY